VIRESSARKKSAKVVLASLEPTALRAATWVARRVGHYCHAVIPGPERAGEHGITDFGLALSLNFGAPRNDQPK